MTYELGGEYNLKADKGLVIRNTGNAYAGFRAFARTKVGTYREVFGLSREEGCFVDGNFEGSYIRHTHETKAEAITLASKAYRYLNR